MDEFGHILREARENKGLTLADVQDKTRINARFLAALEQGNYDRLPTPVHVRGFLRNYARFLGLDPQPLVERYEWVMEQQTAAPPSNSHIETADPLIPPRQDQPFFNPVNYEVDDGRSPNSEPFLRLVIVLALVAALVLAGSNLVPKLLNNNNNEALTEGINQVIQDMADQIGPTAEATAVPEATTDAENPIVSTGRTNTEETAATAPVPTRPILPAMDVIRLKLEITERTWMEVTIDGDVVFSGIAREGDPPYEFEAQDEVIVNTGNAVAVVVTINDIPWGRMGERGENKEEVWRTTN
ncbi:MAG: helix-turn-helix domain-containing protein [Ardenticatenaceae bacterium]|nr:helix-turn-helix domain-containing protein [Ardenticatenaceae bacterium]MCB9446488.1 helix-turn-helix domain-containing protein [Ardenticatenaceae bacterium]